MRFCSLEMILQMLRSHSLFLKSQKLDYLMDDISLIEKQIEALVLSIEDLKGTTLRNAEYG